MKLFYLVVFTLLISSCQSSFDEEGSKAAYYEGIRVLQNETREDYEKALSHFNEAIELNPNNVLAQFRKIDAAMRLGNFELVLSTSKGVLNNPVIEGHELQTNILVSAGISSKIVGEDGKQYFDEALEIYERKLKENPNDLFLISNKVYLLCYLDNQSGAMKFLDTVSINEENKLSIEALKQRVSSFDFDQFINQIKV